MMMAAAWTGMAAAAPPTTAQSYAVFAMQRVRVNSKARIQGDVGALFDTLKLNAHVRVSGVAAAPTVEIGRGARATGGLYCSSVQTNGGDTCQVLPNPLIAAPSIVLVGPASNANITAAKRTKSSSPLPPNTYGTLTLGTASEVILAGGAYQFESIDLASRAKLLCHAACDVAVRGRVSMAQATQLGAGDGVPAAAVTFRIAAQGESTAFDARSRAQVRGSVYAPSAAVSVGSSAKVTGSLVGDTVSVGARARLDGGTPAP
jgi:cytoskeletal protein CcmA (bactofilin family)